MAEGLVVFIEVGEAGEIGVVLGSMLGFLILDQLGGFVGSGQEGGLLRVVVEPFVADTPTGAKVITEVDFDFDTKPPLSGYFGQRDQEVAAFVLEEIMYRWIDTYSV